MQVTITGGAGFIGCNAASYYAKKGFKVNLFDNLSRKGSKNNLDFLIKNYGDQIKFFKGDLRDIHEVQKLSFPISNSDLLLHLAAQVAVTTSVENPLEDFNINALGTLNLLELLRVMKRNNQQVPLMIYSSTNKVYGAMENEGICKGKVGYNFKNLIKGINENQGLDFHSPYGCSKGTADQYVRDYSRLYGLDTLVFRQSCIYGKRQFGVEDQGWIAWFTIANNLKKPITIYGDGEQVRDVLWVEDLIEAYELARKNKNKVSGKIFNIGGGHKNKVSLRKSLENLEKISGSKISPSYSDWRPGDQKVCFMDISNVQRELGWEPKTSPYLGMEVLNNWVLENIKEVEEIFLSK